MNPGGFIKELPNVPRFFELVRMTTEIPDAPRLASRQSSSPLASLGSGNLSGNIRSDAVALLNDQGVAVLLATLVLACVLAVIEAGLVDQRIVFGWFGVMVGVCVLRYALLLVYRRGHARDRGPLFWRKLFIGGAIATALTWGSAGILLFTPASIAHQSLLALILAGVAAAMVPVLAPSLTTNVAFLSLTLLPVTARFVLQASEPQVAMGAVLMVFYLFLLSVARSAHGSMFASLALRRAHLHSIAHLTGAKERAEAAIRQLQTEIQRRGGMEHQLKQAKEDAERASRSKGDFLAAMSHEIRTPMNGVLGALELVKDMPLGKEQRDLVATAYSSAESLIAIINDVLDFSKNEVGRLELEEIDFDLRALVAEIISLVGKRARDKGLAVSYKISERTPRVVRGDPTRLRQILNNLVGNAVKFTSQGKIEVRVDLAQRSSSSIVLRFEVEDTGIGISPAVEASLFKPYTQAEKSMARKFGGTGLGLSITKQLVELMGGQIGVRSAQGEGSTFWFTLYLARPEAGGATIHAPSLPSTAGASGLEIAAQLPEPFQGRVLLVEDNPVHQKVARNVLEGLGLSVTLASDGFRAVAAILERGYDLILMDCEMPGMDGYQATRAIRHIERNHRRNRAPIVAVTANAMKGDRERCLETGMDDYLAKPLTKEMFRKMLASWLPSSVIGPPATSETIVPGLMGGEPELVEPPLARWATGRILVADDDAVSRNLTRAALQRMGFSVDLATGGGEAIEAVRNSTSYRAILIDCEMPDIDGAEAARVIRDIERERGSRRTPILALTGRSEKADRERCLEAGIDDLCTKPVRRETLEHALQRYLAFPYSRGKTEGAEQSLLAASPALALDEAVLTRVRELMDDEFDSLVHTFLTDTPKRISALGEHIRDRDAEAVRAIAHTLKSSAANLGAMRLSQQARRLELLARNGSLASGEALVEELTEEFERARREFETA